MSIPKGARTTSIYRYAENQHGRGGQRDCIAKGPVREIRGAARVRAGEFGGGSFRVEYRSEMNQLLGVDSLKIDKPRLTFEPLNQREKPQKKRAAADAVLAKQRAAGTPSTGGDPVVVFTPSDEQHMTGAAAQWTEARVRVEQRLHSIRALSRQMHESIGTIQVALERNAYSELLSVATEASDVTPLLEHLVTDLDAMRQLAASHVEVGPAVEPKHAAG